MYLKGNKTIIRTIAKKDLPLLVKWKNDPVIAELVMGNVPVTTLELEEKRLERFREDYDTLRLMIETIEEEPIGFISICEIDKFNNKAELGMLIGEKEFWGKGYGSDALISLLNYLFNRLDFNRVGVEVFFYNKRAKKLYEKIGFCVEGVQRQGLLKGGQYVDVYLMGILKKDFLWPKK